MEPGLLLAIDVGTSSAKACLCDIRGQVRGRGHEPYPLLRPGPRRIEQDPEVWWRAVVRAVRASLGSAAPPPIEGISVSSSNALVLLDHAGKAVRPAIMQLDDRAELEVAALRRSLGGPIARATGNRVADFGYWLPVLKWLGKNEPESLARARWLVYPSGYLLLRLTGMPSIDRTRAATTLLFDRRAGAWSEALVRESGVDLAKLPAVVESTTVVGRLDRSAAAALGLPSGIPIVGGAMDSVAAALGLGMLERDDAALMLGTVARAAVLTSAPRLGADIIGCPYPGADLWLSMGVLWGGGQWLQWIVDTFHGGRWDEVCSVDEPEALTGLMAVPPATAGDGAFVGINAGHSLADLGNAGSVGLLAELADVLNAMTPASGLARRRLASCGRGARLTAPLLASLLRQTVEIPDDPETETRGGAVLAACGVGLFPDLASAARGMAASCQVFRPTADWADYAAALRRRRALCRRSIRSHHSPSGEATSRAAGLTRPGPVAQSDRSRQGMF